MSIRPIKNAIDRPSIRSRQSRGQMRPCRLLSCAQRLSTCIVLAVFCSTAPTLAAVPRVNVGDEITGVTFKDIRYLRRTLNDFGDKNAFVLVCMNTTCPVVQQYLPKLIGMENEYRDEGVQFLALYTSSAESVLEMAEHALQLNIPFPAVRDIDGRCAEALGLDRTPEVAVLDASRVLRYRGRIDDQYRTGGAQPNISKDNLKEALDAVLAGREVVVKQTPVDGCLITRPRDAEPRTDLTYADDIHPLLQEHCVECHRHGTEAPFSLTTYDEVVAQGAMIAEVVAEQRMPPWYAGPSRGHFVNARGMSATARDTISDWVAIGMPPGALRDPDPEQSVESDDNAGGWIAGEPDYIITMSEPHELPAQGYIPYTYAMLPYEFPHDTWLQSIEFRPDNPRVVHHCFLMAHIPGHQSRVFISGKAPGVQPLNLEGSGAGVHLPKGTKFELQMHYTPTGRPETCQVAIGIRYCRDVVRKRMRVMRIRNRDFTVPAGDPYFRVSESRKLDADSVGFALLAHMHLRGKDMSFFAHYPDGRTEQLLSVPNYNFNWQIGYEWPRGKKTFPKGTEIEVVAHYDNSAFNPYNPDPTIDVAEGEQTYEEMFDPYFFYTNANEDLNIAVNPSTGQAVLTWRQRWERMRRSADPLFATVAAVVAANISLLLSVVIYAVRRHQPRVATDIDNTSNGNRH